MGVQGPGCVKRHSRSRGIRCSLVHSYSVAWLYGGKVEFIFRRRHERTQLFPLLTLAAAEPMLIIGAKIFIDEGGVFELGQRRSPAIRQRDGMFGLGIGIA